jgi:hypothetical protein
MLNEETMIAAETACRAAGYETRRAPLRLFRDTDAPGDPDCILVGIPNGRFVRWSEITSEYITEMIPRVELPAVTALGDYEALLYEDTREIEVGLRPLSISAVGRLSLKDEFKRMATRTEESDAFRDSWAFELAASPQQEWSAEISPRSSRFSLFHYTRWAHVPVTLKIRGAVASGGHDEALKLLEEVGQAILFELDLQRGMALCFSKISQITRAIRTELAAGQPKEIRVIYIPEANSGVQLLPDKVYPPGPLALYWHARSAAGMPLIQYLASYQVLEYYFRECYEREIMDHIREELAAGGVTEISDVHVRQIIRIARAGGRQFGTERDQLRATIRRYVANTSLKEYLSDGSRQDFFTGEPLIIGVPKIDLGNNSADLRDQVSARIYNLRCRIVHAKSGSQDPSSEPILPFSPDAEALALDIKLIQYLARNVLISSATGLRLPLGLGIFDHLPLVRQAPRHGRRPLHRRMPDA